MINKSFFKQYTLSLWNSLPQDVLIVHNAVIKSLSNYHRYMAVKFKTQPLDLRKQKNKRNWRENVRGFKTCISEKAEDVGVILMFTGKSWEVIFASVCPPIYNLSDSHPPLWIQTGKRSPSPETLHLHPTTSSTSIFYSTESLVSSVSRWQEGITRKLCPWQIQLPLPDGNKGTPCPPEGSLLRRRPGKNGS